MDLPASDNKNVVAEGAFESDNTKIAILAVVISLVVIFMAATVIIFARSKKQCRKI